MPRSSMKKAVKPLTPLLGSWTYSGKSDLGEIKCTRTFTPVLNGHRVRLDAVWSYADPKRADYVELCYFGLNADGALGFVSFINDGSRSEGVLASGTDIDESAICFEAQMPHGLARQAYWPNGSGGWHWRVERKVKAGWSQIIAQEFVPAS